MSVFSSSIISKATLGSLILILLKYAGVRLAFESRNFFSLSPSVSPSPSMICLATYSSLRYSLFSHFSYAYNIAYILLVVSSSLLITLPEMLIISRDCPSPGILDIVPAFAVPLPKFSLLNPSQHLHKIYLLHTHSWWPCLPAAQQRSGCPAASPPHLC